MPYHIDGMRAGCNINDIGWIIKKLLAAGTISMVRFYLRIEFVRIGKNINL